MDHSEAQQNSRTAEELAWDEEFKDNRQEGLAADLESLVRFAVKLPGAVIEAVMPEDTARHTRAAARESFLAVRSLLGAIGDGIENMLAEPGDPDSAPAATVQGPPGTWGTGRAAPSSSKVKRIEVTNHTA